MTENNDFNKSENEKRYILKSDGFLVQIVVDTFENIELSAEGVVNNLNEYVETIDALHEENEQLQFQLNLCSDHRNEFHRRARENANRVGKLEKENEQLRKQLQNFQ